MVGDVVLAVDRRRWIRALSAELRRLRGDALPWMLLLLTVLPAVSLAASLPAEVREAPSPVRRALLDAVASSAVGGLLLFAALLGALAVALAARTGVLARELMCGSAVCVFVARGFSGVFASTLFGVVGVALLDAVSYGVSGEVLMEPGMSVRSVGAVIGAGLWGYLIGVIVRSPILVLFVVPLSLVPGELFAGALPRVTEFLPHPVMLSLAGASSGGVDGPGAAALVAAWFVGLGVLAVLVVRHRDRL